MAELVRPSGSGEQPAAAAAGVNCSLQLRLLFAAPSAVFCSAADSCDWYYRAVFCSLPQLASPLLPVFKLVLLVLWVCYLFLAVAVVAEEYMVPLLGYLSRVLGLSDSLAGVTLLAFGNGAPDIFASRAALARGAPSASLAVGALFGAAMFNMCIVFGAILLRSPPFKLAVRPLVRDLVFYIASSYFIAHLIFVEGSLSVLNAGLLFCIYVCYILTVTLGSKLGRMWSRGRRISVRVFGSEERLAGIGDEDSEDEVSASLDPDLPANVHDVNEVLRLSHPVHHAPHHLVRPGGVNGAVQAVHAGGRPPTRQVLEPHLGSYSNEFSANDALMNPRLAPAAAAATGGFREELRQALLILLPFTTQDLLDEKGWLLKLVLIVKSPIVLALNLLVHVCDTHLLHSAGWCRLAVCSQLTCGTLFCFFMALPHQVYTLTLLQVAGLEVQLYMAVGAGLALVIAGVFVTSQPLTPPPAYHVLIALWSFAISFLITSQIADQIVDVVLFLGELLGVSNVIIGVTAMAWGNSLGDLVGNCAVATLHSPRMAVAATLAAPLMNLLLGLSLPGLLDACLLHRPVAFQGTIGNCALWLALMAAALALILLAVCSLGHVKRSAAFAVVSLYFLLLLIVVSVDVKYPHTKLDLFHLDVALSNFFS